MSQTWTQQFRQWLLKYGNQSPHGPACGPVLSHKFMGWLYQSAHDFQKSEEEEWAFMADQVLKIGWKQYLEACYMLEQHQVAPYTGKFKLGIDQRGEVHILNPYIRKAFHILAHDPKLQVWIPRYGHPQLSKAERKFRKQVVCPEAGLRVKDFDGCSTCHAPWARKVCKACRYIRYCNVECQKADWSQHKKLCRAIRSTKQKQK